MVLLVVLAPFQYYFAQKKWVSRPLQRGIAVPEAAVMDRSGQPWSANDERGRMVVLSFWASWCGPCRRELPALDSLYRELDSTESVRVYAVNVNESMETADRYAADMGLKLPLLYDTAGTVADLFSVHALPTLMVIDKEGRIDWVKTGYEPWAINTVAQIVDDQVPGAFGELPNPEDIIFERTRDGADSVATPLDSLLDHSDQSEAAP